MGAVPLCPLVLSLLAVEPRRLHEVARALGGVDATRPSVADARATLRRLTGAGLVRERRDQAGWLFQITGRGRRELAVQRLLWLGVVRMEACRRLTGN